MPDGPIEIVDPENTVPTVLRDDGAGETATVAVDVSQALAGDRAIEWATDRLWEEFVDVVNGKMTLSEVLNESQFATHRIGPPT